MRLNLMLEKGVCFIGLLALLNIASPKIANAQYTFSLLHSFNSTGAGPEAGVSLDQIGNLYGTTVTGGLFSTGTVFKMDSSGNNFLLMHSFSGTTTANGSSPFAGLIMDSSSNLYGTTEGGGTTGSGTVFKIDKTGINFTIIHSFDSSSVTDGAEPYSNLIMNSTGTLYGTTAYGGEFGEGTVFRMDSSGNHFAIIHSFQFSTTDGDTPVSGLVMDNRGNLYGTTEEGGLYGYGTVYEIDSTGHFSLLHSFPFNNPMDGANPIASLIMDSNGNLYGTTQFGGQYGYGTVFELNSFGQFSLLHSFNSANTQDGNEPAANLIMDLSGRIYGTTVEGGLYGSGTVFAMDKSGNNFTLLHSFDSKIFTDGSLPIGGLNIDAKGNIFGTTQNGGMYGHGTVFVLANDIRTPSVIIEPVGYERLPGTHTITQILKIINSTGSSLTGPFHLVISGLPSGITVMHASGVTQFNDPGSPYLNLGISSLSPGQDTQVTIFFNDPGLILPSYYPVLLEGNGNP